MKNILLTIASSLLLISCGGETEKETASQINKVCKKGYDVDSTTIGFGGFKYTEKTEVKGIFEKFTVEGTKVADTPEEVFANATISIPISTIETKNPNRNKRIEEDYFGKMESTFLIKGSIVKFNKGANEVIINITLNKVSKDITLNYSTSGDVIKINGELNILDFDASKALRSIHTVCEALHTGSDGVSKTWAEANLYITSKLKKSCE